MSSKSQQQQRGGAGAPEAWRGPFMARFTGMVLAIASAVAFMIASRPATTRDAGEERPAIANTVGVGLGALGLSSFAAGSVLERRARQADEQRVETRVNNRANVAG